MRIPLASGLGRGPENEVVCKQVLPLKMARGRIGVKLVTKPLYFERAIFNGKACLQASDTLQPGKILHFVLSLFLSQIE